MTSNWDKFSKLNFKTPSLNLFLDLSKSNFELTDILSFEDKFQKALSSIKELESGSIANISENRQVGHYWLRNTEIAPNKEIRSEINNAINEVKSFTNKISDKYSDALIIGIGGSALGSQLLQSAFQNKKSNVFLHFLDNTDPAGISLKLESLEDKLDRTLVIVVSKSGGTVETRNALIETKEFYKKSKIDFSNNAVAITCNNSKLHQTAKNENWLKTFPLWDFVGGRTSITSPVGLLPLALLGKDIDLFLEGARAMDKDGRSSTLTENLSALLAISWHINTEGSGKKDMVVIPYKDSLEIFSKYLQQLIMESLGKEKDREGKVVNQGINVFGNKGSTDQHAYIQQLREGVENFFVTFIEVLKDSNSEQAEVEESINSGDYLQSFFLGTREALKDKKRRSITLTLEEINERNLGALISLYERAVSFYAEMININAYDQPGVEAGKTAAKNIIDLKKKICSILKEINGEEFSAPELCEKLKIQEENTEIIYKLLMRLAFNSPSMLKIDKITKPNEQKFRSIT